MYTYYGEKSSRLQHYLSGRICYARSLAALTLLVILPSSVTVVLGQAKCRKARMIRQKMSALVGF